MYQFRRFFLGVLIGFSASCLASEDFTQEIIMIPHAQGGSLETTIYRPAGPGPFPLVVINHGKAYGDARDEPRYRAYVASREFLRHGYMVALPMRIGFSKSSGSYTQFGCDAAKDGYKQAESIASAVNYLLTRRDVKNDAVIVVGQSYGGFSTVAYGATQPPPNVKAIINFSGGLRKAAGGCLWDQALYRAFEDFGKTSRIPSLWLYTENDGFFPPWLSKTMYERFSASGGVAQYVLLERFGSNGHFLFDELNGLPIWSSQIEKFLKKNGMPY